MSDVVRINCSISFRPRKLSNSEFSKLHNNIYFGDGSERENSSWFPATVCLLFLLLCLLFCFSFWKEFVHLFRDTCQPFAFCIETPYFWMSLHNYGQNMWTIVVVFLFLFFFFFPPMFVKILFFNFSGPQVNMIYNYCSD